MMKSPGKITRNNVYGPKRENRHILYTEGKVESEAIMARHAVYEAIYSI
jgi:DNA-dependent RNA polymerase auxiliary subunit epsilon